MLLLIFMIKTKLKVNNTLELIIILGFNLLTNNKDDYL
jgi:hypothetical protein